MSDIIYAIYDGNIQEGGVYNVLASFERGILKGFKKVGMKAYTYEECKKKGITPDIALGFNLAGAKNWEDVLGSPKTLNIMWSVDSIFSQNFAVIQELSKYENYVQFSVANSDVESAKHYMPNLKCFYMPHATDCELWKDKNIKSRENDIVFFSTLRDFELQLENLKNQNNKLLYSFAVEIIDILQKQPNMTFWEVYNLIKDTCKIEFPLKGYQFIFDFTSLYVEQIQKIKMIQKLSNFNVKVYGNDLWKKYIKGKVQYMGSANIEESIEIMNNSKISLHCHPIHLNKSFHERFLNAGAVGTFNLISETPNIQEIFQDTFGYFNHTNFDNIEEKANYYLKNDDERIEKSKKAKEIILKDHQWANRALTIDSMFSKINT